MMSLKSGTAYLFTVVALASCGLVAPTPAVDATTPSVAPPALRWDHVEGSERWTQAGFAALDTHAAILPDLVPEDIDTWCPGYAEAGEDDRAAFWVGLLSALAQYESTWNPEAVGGGGRWFGLTQISPATARFYGCEAGDGSSLLDGSANVRCALRIWATTVARDGVVSAGRGGVAADWGPFTVASRREAMREWSVAQPYCQP